jgi:hypothetical protein
MKSIVIKFVVFLIALFSLYISSYYFYLGSLVTEKNATVRIIHRIPDIRENDELLSMVYTWTAASECLLKAEKANFISQLLFKESIDKEINSVKELYKGKLKRYHSSIGPKLDFCKK